MELTPISERFILHWGEMGTRLGVNRTVAQIHALLAARRRLQLLMADMAALALAAGRSTLPRRYWRCARRWEWLGYPAFASMIAVYFLMVTKPTLAGP
ncbi:DUF2269 family protein [Cupriavidus sp. 8B]